jgi:hypothetical protein
MPQPGKRVSTVSNKNGFFLHIAGDSPPFRTYMSESVQKHPFSLRKIAAGTVNKG